MATKTINVDMLAKMFLAGAQNIEAKKEYINELNVFPVPDGDTGTNMSLTIMAAAKEVMGRMVPGKPIGTMYPPRPLWKQWHQNWPKITGRIPLLHRNIWRNYTEFRLSCMRSIMGRRL